MASKSELVDENEKLSNALDEANGKIGLLEDENIQLNEKINELIDGDKSVPLEKTVKMLWSGKAVVGETKFGFELKEKSGSFYADIPEKFVDAFVERRGETFSLENEE